MRAASTHWRGRTAPSDAEDAALTTRLWAESEKIVLPF
jgi:hypothetical protein